MKHNEVNWRSGTASIYESEWSLARKYCYLNRVTMNDIDEPLLLLRQTYKGNRARDGKVEPKEKTLSRYLGESGGVLRYRHIEHYLMPSVIVGDEQHWTPKHLRYCPLCMERGYHSPIYQLPWVVRCPLHGIPLVEHCNKCSKQIDLKRWPSNWRIRRWGRDSKQVCCCDIWPGMRSWEWPPGLRKDDTRPIGAYLKWLKSLTSAPEAFLASAGLRTLCREQLDFDTALELFCVWQTLVPPPPAVRDFLIEPQTQISASVSLSLPLTDDKAESLVSLVRNDGYHSIMESLAINYIYRNRTGAWNFILRRIVKNFAGHHRQCQYFKRIAKRHPSLSATSFLDEHCGDICRRLPFIEALTAKWIILWGLGKYLESVLADFHPLPCHHIERELQAIGLLSLETVTPADIPNKAYPEMFWTASAWDPKFSSLLERLLSYEALAIASALIETYRTYDNNDPYMDFDFCDADVVPPRHPYLLAIHTPGHGLTIRIWPRHAPIVMPNDRENAKDRHRLGIIDYLEWKRKWVTAKKHREIIEGFDRLREFLQQRSANPTGPGLIEQPMPESEKYTPRD